MDDIEEFGRYSKGGKPRGGELSRCNMRWEVTKDCTVIVFDYSTYEGMAEEQFKKLGKKYENQQCNLHCECSQCARYESDLKQHIITIRFVDEEQTKRDFKMCLRSDAQ